MPYEMFISGFIFSNNNNFKSYPFLVHINGSETKGIKYDGTNFVSTSIKTNNIGDCDVLFSRPTSLQLSVSLRSNIGIFAQIYEGLNLLED